MPKKTIVIYVDSSVIGAQSAKKSYMTTLKAAGYNVVVVEGTRSYDVTNKLKSGAIKNFVGLIVIGHGLYDHSNQLTRSHLKQIKPAGGYELLVLQSCRSFSLVNPGGYKDGATDLMAQNGLLIVNYRYSSVVGLAYWFNRQIHKWASGQPTGDVVSTYRILIYYNFIVDVVETPLGWYHGFGSPQQAGQKGTKHRAGKTFQSKRRKQLR